MSTDAFNVISNNSERSDNISNSIEGINSLMFDHVLPVEEEPFTSVTNDQTPHYNARLNEIEPLSDTNTDISSEETDDEADDGNRDITSHSILYNNTETTNYYEEAHATEPERGSQNSDNSNSNIEDRDFISEDASSESEDDEDGIFLNVNEQDSESLSNNSSDEENVSEQLTDTRIDIDDNRAGTSVESNSEEQNIDGDDQQYEDIHDEVDDKVKHSLVNYDDSTYKLDTPSSCVSETGSLDTISFPDTLDSSNYNLQHDILDCGKELLEKPLSNQSNNTFQKEKKSVSFNESIGFGSVDNEVLSEPSSLLDLCTTINTGENSPDNPLTDRSDTPEHLDTLDSKCSGQVSSNLSFDDSNVGTQIANDSDSDTYENDNDWEQSSDDEKPLIYLVGENVETSTSSPTYVQELPSTDTNADINSSDVECATIIYRECTPYTDDNSCSLTMDSESSNMDSMNNLDSNKSEITNENPVSKSYSEEIKTGCENIVSLQNTLNEIFRKSALLLQEYKAQLTTEQLKDFALHLTEFHENFTALAKLFLGCENLSLSLNKELKEIRHVTDEVCTLINRKFRDEDLITWIDHKEDDYLDKERLQEERLAANKALLAKAAEARASSAKTVTVAAETEKIIADSEAEAAETQLAAKKAREVAEDALKAAEDAARAAEERKKSEDEAKRRADEKAKLKAEEERIKKEELEKRLEAEAKKKGSSIDIERSREEAETARKEAERKNPNNWPRFIYSIEVGDFDPGIGCIVRAMDGSLNREDIEVHRIDQLSRQFQLFENEELISNIIEIKQTDTDKPLQFDEPFSLLISHCAPRATTGREPVMKWLNTNTGLWSELPTNELIVDDIKDIRFVEGRGNHFGLFAVVYRLKREHFTFTKKGGKLTSGVDSRFTFTIKPGAFRYNIGITTEVQPVDNNTVSELRINDSEVCRNLLSATPIIKIKWVTTRKLPKPVTITLPCPPSPSRLKRPSTGITRDKMSKSDMRPQTAKASSSYMKKDDGGKIEEELHLLYKDGDSETWTKVPGAVLTQAKNKDIVSYDMTEPMDRFVVLRTKLELADYQVEKIAKRLESALLQKNIKIFLRQRGEDLKDILVSCASTNKVEKVLRRLMDDGYDEGPPTSKDISVTEGQVLEIRFRGNLAPDSTQLRTRFAFNSHIPCQIKFRVDEQDRFAQRGFDSFLGFSQIYTDGLVPRTIHDQEEKDTNKSRNPQKTQNVRIEMIEGEILLSELLMTVPKPEPEPPKPLMTAPVSIKPTGALNDEVFRLISTELGDEWKKLAQYLNVRRMRMQAILRQNVNSEKQHTIYDMLVSWAKRVPRAMDKVEMLCHALSICGRSDLVEMLKERNREFKRELAFSARDSYLRKAFLKVARDEKVSGDWKVLAKRLGLGDHVLHEIEGSRSTRQDRCFSSLQKWRDMKDVEATIPNLSQKLRECRYRGLAREIDAIG